MKKINLKKVAQIAVGFSFRKKIEHQETGDILVIMAQDLKDDFYLTDTTDLTKINYSSVRTDRFIKKNDVLLSFKGYFTATVSKIEGIVIAASSVYVLKANRDILLPEYLALWLNSKVGQTEINKNVTGATIKTILKKDLESIKIEVPSLSKQQEIVEFYHTTEKLKSKLKTKAEKVENIFQGALTQAIK